MKSKMIKKVQIALSLDEDEAKWLKSLMQNPIGCSQDEEDPIDEDMRMRFWDALFEIDKR